MISTEKTKIEISNWYVIYTKSRHEKKVAENLHTRGIECYCPVKVEENQWKDRKKKVTKPLFNSYCFVKLPESELRKVFETYGVVQFVYWCGKPAVVKHSDIEELKRWLNDFDPNSIEVQYFKPNDKVTIDSGIFIKRTANVIQQNGNQLVLLLDELGIKLLTKTNEVVLGKAI